MLSYSENVISNNILATLELLTFDSSIINKSRSADDMCYGKNSTEAIDCQAKKVYVYDKYIPLNTLVNVIRIVTAKVKEEGKPDIFDKIIDITEKITENTLNDDGAAFKNFLEVPYGFVGVHRNRIPYIVYKYLKKEPIAIEAVKFVKNFNYFGESSGSWKYYLNFLKIPFIELKNVSYEKDIEPIEEENYKLPPARTIPEQILQVEQHESIVYKFLQEAEGNNMIYESMEILEDVVGSFYKETEEIIKYLSNNIEEEEWIPTL